MSRTDPAAPATALTWHRDAEPRQSRLAPSVLAAAASFVALWPYTSVIEPGSWSFTVVAVIVVVAGAGVGLRVVLDRRRPWLRETLTLCGQVLAALAAVTLLTAGGTAVLGLIPTSSTFATFGALAGSAWEQVVYGAAPLPATPGLRLVLALGFVVVAVLLDHLVVQRSAVLAALLTASVGALPMIVTLGDANVVWFVLLGILVLVLFRQTADRHPHSPRRSSSVVAAGIGAAALVATVVVAPAVPVSATLSGTGSGVIVDASLRLGNDLRQPNPVEVLTLATDADTAPYLRLTTLSQFNGRVWLPDENETQALSEGFGPAEWTDDIASETTRTSIKVLRMSSAWLPVPYPATGVQGLTGAWKLVPDNRTVTSRTSDAVGNDYTVVSERVTPTLEQIRAASAADDIVDSDARTPDIPAIVSRTAEQVTAEATNDYDRLIALQNWFRSDFTYSLETPVDQGFDGTGADAVARFLEVKSGYCIHFAGAFALMAESLGMEVRIVVGYLPGAPTDEKRGDESVYAVTSDQLHSWPEVLFPGIGWVPFEPTASLGVPTAFSPAATTGGDGPSAPSTPVPTAMPGAQETSGPEIDRGDTGGSAGGTDTLRRLDPTPVTLVALGAVLVLLLPAMIRRSLRALRRGRARRGDAAAAWAEVRATLLDLQVAVSDADSPRRRGAALVRDNGVDGEAMATLTDAVERLSYARSAERSDLTPALDEVLRRLHRSVDRPARVRALLLPRSLFAGRGVDAPLLA